MHAQAPSPKGGTPDPVRLVAIACGGLTGLFVLVILGFHFSRDTWERDNRKALMARLQKAFQGRDEDPVGAYNEYTSVLQEVGNREIQDDLFREQVEAATSAVVALKPVAEREIQRIKEIERRRAEAEAKRRAEEEAARVEAERIAAELKAKEEQAKKEREWVGEHLDDAVKAARQAFNAMVRLDSRIQTGINYGDYTKAVGETRGEIEIFKQSPYARAFPDFGTKAELFLLDHQLALAAWKDKIDTRSVSLEALAERRLQEGWANGGKRLEEIKELMNRHTVSR